MKKWILTTSFQNPHSGTDSLFSGTPSKPFKVVFQAHLNRVNGRRNKICSIYVHYGRHLDHLTGDRKESLISKHILKHEVQCRREKE